MRLTDLPADQRPRERLHRHGAAALNDAELLAIFLRVGHAGASALDLAQRLLVQHGGLAGVAAAPLHELVKSKGLGPAKAAQLAAAVELVRRSLAAELSVRDALTSPAAAGDYLRLWLGRRPNEVFAALFLDNRHRVIAAEELFQGTIDGASVHPREVVRRALSHNAAALIVAHNHPSGIAEPSAADLAITRRLREALALVDIRLVDHLIVGEGVPTSLAERGLL
jgi:DNA repair protein RadC